MNQSVPGEPGQFRMTKMFQVKQNGLDGQRYSKWIEAPEVHWGIIIQMIQGKPSCF